MKNSNTVVAVKIRARGLPKPLLNNNLTRKQQANPVVALKQAQTAGPVGMRTKNITLKKQQQKTLFCVKDSKLFTDLVIL